MKMVKYIISLCAMICTTAAFGSFQYDVSNETFKTNDAGYFDILQNAVLNISYDSSGSKFGQVESFGYFTLDSNGNILTTQELNVKANTTVSTVELKAGDKVGFWLKTDKTKKTLYSINALNQNGRNYFNDILSKGGGVLFTFGDNKWDNRVLSFSVAYTNEGPSGQPLPGILATLLLGGGALAFSKMRRAKAR